MRRPAAKRPALDVSDAAPGAPAAGGGVAAFVLELVPVSAFGFAVSEEEDAQAPTRRASAKCADRTAAAAAWGRRARNGPRAR